MLNYKQKLIEEVLNETECYSNKCYVQYYDGGWAKKNFDSKGDTIFCENSNVYWLKREYNSNGDKIYFGEFNY